MNSKYKLLISLVLMLASAVLIYQTLNNGYEIKSSFAIDKKINQFNLKLHSGENFSYNSVSNSPILFFFGFLNCPDICPATILRISKIIEDLEDESDKIKYFFVTVDPERDTSDELKKYLEAFDDNIIGITGDKEDMHDFLKYMHVYFKKVFLDKDLFTFDHSAQIYLFDKKGIFFGTISSEENSDIVLKKIRAIF